MLLLSCGDAEHSGREYNTASCQPMATAKQKREIKGPASCLSTSCHGFSSLTSRQLLKVQPPSPKHSVLRNRLSTHALWRSFQIQPLIRSVCTFLSFKSLYSLSVSRESQMCLTKDYIFSLKLNLQDGKEWAQIFSCHQTTSA